MNLKKIKLGLQAKMVRALILMAVLLMAVLTPTVSGLYRARMEQYYTNIAFNEASIAAQLIDGDAVERYYQTGETDAYYEQIRKQLLLVKKTVGLRYFYVVVPEETQMVYIWDVGEADDPGICSIGDREDYYGGGNERMHAAFHMDAPRNILITNNEEYGYLASAYVAIPNSQGQPVALASVDVSMDIINAQIGQFVLLMLLITAGVLVLSMLVFFAYLRGVLIAPLGVLHAALHGLTQTQMDKLDTVTVDVHTGDELQDLAQGFEFMAHELSSYIRNLSAVTAEKERIGAELSVATQIQFSMLPCIFPAFPDQKEFDIYATMDPAKEVGGDFYDFFMVDERHLAVVVADVSGKGVPAALFMVIGKTLIKDHTMPGEDLGKVFAEVNDLLCESNSEGLFITAFEGVLDLETGEFRFVNAGHEVPYICRKGADYAPQPLRAGFVLAGMEGFRYKEGSLMLCEGDRFFQYTDGVTEATDKDNQLYGSERLQRVLSANRNASPEELLPAVKADIDAFVGEAPQFDDITMLCLEFKKRMKEQECAK